MSRSSSRNKPRFSFRDVDPYSKTKSINIQKVQRDGMNYVWDKENDGSAVNKGRRPRTVSSESAALKGQKGSFEF